MKRVLQLSALAAFLLSQTSCGLPMAAARSVGRLAQSVGGLASSLQ